MPKKSRKMVDDRKKVLAGLKREEASSSNHNNERRGMMPLPEFAEKWSGRKLRTVYEWKEKNLFPGLFKWAGTHWQVDLDFWFKHCVKDQPLRPSGAPQ